MKNLENEPGSWDEDFSYPYLQRLYGALRGSFAMTRFKDAEAALQAATSEEPVVFIRHDIDVTLTRAVELARVEREWGVVSTYHVMIDSPFYDVRSDESRAMLREILALGHEVGLHYDVVARRTVDVDAESRIADIDAACETLSDALGAPVRSLSFHLPVPDLIRGPLLVGGRVSAYAAPLLGWYISDSRARWREGAPIEQVERKRGPVLQVLVHPMWWGEKNLRPDVRLRDILVELAPRVGRTFEDLRVEAWRHIIYRAADPSEVG
jgi:hypothetical protein